MRPQHPEPTDPTLRIKFHKHLARTGINSRGNEDGIQWTDWLRPQRRRRTFENKLQMTLKTLVEVTGAIYKSGKNKGKLREPFKQTKSELLTTKLRLKKPRQGQDTRLCSDATSTAINAVKRTTKTRDNFRPNQHSKLGEYRCRCRCTATCPNRHTNPTSCKCKPVKSCNCEIRQGCGYLLGYKGQSITKRYVGESIMPFDRFHRHMTNAHSDFDRHGKDGSRMETAIRRSGPHGHKKWFMIILQDVPKLDGDTSTTLQRHGNNDEN